MSVIGDDDTEKRVDKRPNDPKFLDQWAFHNQGQFDLKQDADIDALEAWSIQESAEDIVVAILDSGVSINHPDLKENIWVNKGEIPNNGLDDDKNGYIDDLHGWDFVNDKSLIRDLDGHGTAVAGVVGAVGNNNIGVTGIARKVKLMVLKVNENNKSKTEYLVTAIQYAINNEAFILNFSHTWRNDRAYRKVIQEANKADVLMVTGAGGHPEKLGRNIDHRAVYPASYSVSHLIVVAGTNAFDAPMKSSHYGVRTVDLYAPAWRIMTTTIFPKDSYAAWSGNSFSAPIVSGAAALIKSCDPDLSALEIKNILIQNVDKISSLEDKCVSGGRINIHSCLLKVVKSQSQYGSQSP